MQALWINIRTFSLFENAYKKAAFKTNRGKYCLVFFLVNEYGIKLLFITKTIEMYIEKI